MLRFLWKAFVFISVVHMGITLWLVWIHQGERRMYRGKPETMAAINDAVDNGLFTADAMLQELMAALDGTELTECWDYIKRNWEIEDEG